MIKTPMDMRALLHSFSVAAWSYAAIGALVESGLADQLAQPRTLDELSCTAFPAHRVRALVDVAVAHGIVVADGDRYRLADGAAQIACGPLRVAVTGDIRSHLMQPLALVEAATGTTPTSTWSHTDPRVLQAQGDASSMFPGMLKMQLAELGDLGARLDRGAKFLDIGTGVGALAIAMARAFPNLHVVGLDVFDPPLAIARTNVARAALGDRVELRKLAAHDLRDDGAYALAWLPSFFIAEADFTPTLARVHAALETGGWLLTLIGGGGSPVDGAVSRLVTDTWGGPQLTPAATEAALTAAGFTQVRTMPAPPWAPQLIVGRR
jgi:SAM-dependent methyltransferase